MTFRSALVALPLSTLPLAAAADVPNVVTDIAPIYGLVARVMDGVGEPYLLVPPGASPHGYSLRPSDARALSGAQAVFWVGEALEPWLESSLDQLATDAEIVELLAEPGTTLLQFREGAVFGGEEGHAEHEDHAHGEGHAHEDHDDHAEHGHDDHDHDHEGHDEDHHAEEGHDDHAGHHHEGVDPHAWLAPANGQLWMQVIAEHLAALDPEHAADYRANAAAGQAEIDAVVATLSADLEQVEGQFVVFHDAYQYFETSFNLSSLGAISLGDASDPSVARIAEVRDAVLDAGVSCVFSEPQFNPGLVASVVGTSDIKSLVIDPLGTEVPLGADFYTNFLSNTGRIFKDCLSK